MKKHFKTIGLLFAPILLLAGLLTGCQETDYTEPKPSTGPSTTKAQVLFVHAAPDAPTLNVLVNNEQLASLTYGQGAPAYLPVQPLTVQLRAKAATGVIGGTLADRDLVYRPQTATNDNNFSFTANTSYSVFVTDTVGKPKPSATTTNLGGIQFLVVTDPLPTRLPADSAFVRFLHLAPGGPAVTVRVRPAGTTTAFANLTGAANIAYRNGNTSNSLSLAFNRVKSGTYDVQVVTGTALTQLLLIPNVTLASQKIYTLYARGLAGRTGAQALSAGVVAHN